MDYERIEQLLAELKSDLGGVKSDLGGFSGRMDDIAERLNSLEARRYEEALTLYDNLRVST